MKEKRKITAWVIRGKIPCKVELEIDPNTVDGVEAITDLGTGLRLKERPYFGTFQQLFNYEEKRIADAKTAAAILLEKLDREEEDLKLFERGFLASRGSEMKCCPECGSQRITASRPEYIDPKLVSAGCKVQRVCQVCRHVWWTED